MKLIKGLLIGLVIVLILPSVLANATVKEEDFNFAGFNTFPSWSKPIGANTEINNGVITLHPDKFGSGFNFITLNEFYNSKEHYLLKNDVGVYMGDLYNYTKDIKKIGRADIFANLTISSQTVDWEGYNTSSWLILYLILANKTVYDGHTHLNKFNGYFFSTKFVLADLLSKWKDETSKVTHESLNVDLTPIAYTRVSSTPNYVNKTYTLTGVGISENYYKALNESYFDNMTVKINLFYHLSYYTFKNKTGTYVAHEEIAYKISMAIYNKDGSEMGKASSHTCVYTLNTDTNFYKPQFELYAFKEMNIANPLKEKESARINTIQIKDMHLNFKGYETTSTGKNTGSGNNESNFPKLPMTKSGKESSLLVSGLIGIGMMVGDAYIYRKYP